MSQKPESRLAYSTDGAHLRTAQEPEPEAVAKGSTRLRLERRAGDRLVTLVTGLPGSASETQALARELRQAVSAGGSAKDGGLELQGDQREKLEAILRRRGIHSKRSGGEPPRRP